MHMDDTLKIFDETTVILGQQFRSFTSVTCPAFDTYELPCEFDRRKSRKQKESDAGTSAPITRQRKTFNLQTYKYHSLGDYVSTIKRLGTCDSYSTQVVSIEPIFRAFGS